MNLSFTCCLDLHAVGVRATDCERRHAVVENMTEQWSLICKPHIVPGGNEMDVWEVCAIAHSKACCVVPLVYCNYHSRVTICSITTREACTVPISEERRAGALSFRMLTGFVCHGFIPHWIFEGPRAQSSVDPPPDVTSIAPLQSYSDSSPSFLVNSFGRLPRSWVFFECLVRGV